MRSIDEIENDLINEIGISGNEKMQNFWLELQAAKNAKDERFAARVVAKDPVVIGAAIGAIVGHLFSKD